MARIKYVPHAWENVPCPFCSSTRTKLHEKYGPELQYTYVKCRDCKLIYQSPRPKYDETFLKAAYSEYHIFNQNYSYSGHESWDKEISEIKRFDKKRSNILDVGSCMGDFLYAAKKEYKQCTGIEVAENMAAFTEQQLNIKVFRTSFLDIDFKEKFTCVHLSHIIEHVPNPKDWLRKVKDVLEEDGVLAMSVPHMHSLDRRFKLFLKRIGLRKGNWKDNTRTPDHLFEPTIPSTIRFLNDNGFRILEYYTYSRKDMDAKTLFGRIYNRWFKLGSNLRFFAVPVKGN